MASAQTGETALGGEGGDEEEGGEGGGEAGARRCRPGAIAAPALSDGGGERRSQRVIPIAAR